MDEPRTIFALSTAPGRAGVAVVRLTGPAAGAVIDALAGPRGKPRMAALRRIREPATGEVLDEALVFWLEGPRTETGEDMAELHLHGSPAVVKSVLEVLARQPGCRLAEPGEFVRRAFENGKLDLAEVEGLADLINAETEAQRRQALRQMQGALSELYEGWRARLVEACALVESAIDFSDEADVADDAYERARIIIAQTATHIGDHLDDDNRGEIVREGFRVVLTGAPNVGKSSLLNALARREAAIVSEEAGTTRDVIEVRLDLDGFAVIVSDTAGIREARGAVEQEGIRRTLVHAGEADLVIWLTDALASRTPPPPGLGRSILWVVNKIDLGTPSGLPEGTIAISAKTGAGLDALAGDIARRAYERVGTASAPAITRARYREQLNACMSALQAFMSGPATDIELRAEDLRRATHALGRITGRVDVEDVLGEIFARFCIGK